jgi:amino acid transporter
MSRGSLKRVLSLVEYFAFGFGTMVGVGWVVLIDDWLRRGGPAGAMAGFLLAGVLLFPVALTYGRLVRSIPDAGAEIAYADGVFPPWLGFAAGWTMVLCYAIVCPWEAVALGNLLARAFPAIDVFPLYEVAGKTAYAPRVALGLLLTGLIAYVNYRGVHVSGVLQNVGTYGLLALFAVFSALGLARGEASNLQPVFAHPGLAGAGLSVLLVLQVVPYFMTGFESVAKGSEESREGFDPRGFARAIAMALAAGALFYATAVGVVSFVFPWRTLVAEKLGTESAFERAFGARWIADLVLFAAFVSLVKIFNANFLASTRLLFALGRRGLVHPSLGAVHDRHGTPHVAVALMAALTVVAALLGDALLIPITEVGSLASGAGWLSACAAFLLRAPKGAAGRRTAWAGALVGLAIVCMKVVPGVPGSFTLFEWMVVGGWAALGWTFWALRSGFQDRLKA